MPSNPEISPDGSRLRFEGLPPRPTEKPDWLKKPISNDLVTIQSDIESTPAITASVESSGPKFFSLDDKIRVEELAERSVGQHYTAQQIWELLYGQGQSNRAGLKHLQSYLRKLPYVKKTKLEDGRNLYHFEK